MKKKSVGRPKVIGIKRPKLVEVKAAILPETKYQVDQLVAANGTRSSWIAGAIKDKLKREQKKRAKQGEKS